MTSSPNEANERRPASNHWRRRGLLAGVATLVAGAVARASAKVAEAADGQAVVLGSPNNAAASPTVVNRNPGNGVTPAAAFGAIGGAGLTCIFWTGYLHGVGGGTNDTNGDFSGGGGDGLISGGKAQNGGR